MPRAVSPAQPLHTLSGAGRIVLRCCLDPASTHQDTLQWFCCCQAAPAGLSEIMAVVGGRSEGTRRHCSKGACSTRAQGSSDELSRSIQCILLCVLGGRFAMEGLLLKSGMMESLFGAVPLHLLAPLHSQSDPLQSLINRQWKEM